MCVVGEGSAQYAIQAFWTAAAYDVPVTFLVLRNDEYAILKWFGTMENVTGAPGLDLPALDVVAVASGYGVESTRVAGRDELRDALERGDRARAGRRSSRCAWRPGWRWPEPQPPRSNPPVTETSRPWSGSPTACGAWDRRW